MPPQTTLAGILFASSSVEEETIIDALPTRPATAEDLPVEILIHIYQHLDIDSVYRLARASLFFRRVFLLNRPGILLPVLQREFSPFDELLQAYTAAEEDLGVAGPEYLRKRVVFRRNPLDAGVQLAAGSPHLRTLASAQDEFVRLEKSQSVPGSAPSRPSADGPVVLTDADITPLLRWCYVVRRWEELFPHLRWIRNPADCRFLHPHERERLRRALYRWWLYARHFHGEFGRPHAPVEFECLYPRDLLCGQLRRYSSRELKEILDLVAAVEDLIKQYFIPVLMKDFSMTHPEQTLPDPGLSHIDCSFLQAERHAAERVLQTYAKLDPAELLSYFDNLYSYSKTTLITDIKIRRPGFTRGQATLAKAANVILFERGVRYGVFESLSTPRYGIVGPDDSGRRDNDHDDPLGEVGGARKIVWGRAPIPSYGDDGMTLDETATGLVPGAARGDGISRPVDQVEAEG